MASTTSPGSSASEPLVPTHTPMSERQQLALIKRLEKANNNARQNNGDPDSSILASPPRAPLQVVTDANGGCNSFHSSCSSSIASDSPISNNTPVSTPSLKKALQSPAVDRLLKKISKKNTKGETPLHTAAIRGSSRLVRQLLQMGADPNAQDNAEWSPLHEACNRGNLSVVKVLTEFGADLNLKGFGKDSPLHDAARNGHLKVVKFLVRSGANLNAKNAGNRTPREEAEVTRLRIQDNDELDQTVDYLIDQEDQGNEKSSKASILAEMASESSDDDTNSDNETENNDITKFLGLAKSPVVQQALQSLGCLEGNATEPNSKELLQQKRNRSSSRKSKATAENQKVLKNQASTPTKRVLSEPPTKVRLTYENATEEPKVKAPNEKVKAQIEFESPVKKLKLEDQKVEVKQEEIEVSEEKDEDSKKVPPLKIVLANKKAQDAENDTSFNFEYYMKKRKLRPPQTAVVRPLRPPSPVTVEETTVEEPVPDPEDQESKVKVEKKVPLTDIEKYQNIRKAIEVKRKNMFPVYPKPPEGFKDYLMNRKTYLLQENAGERLRSMPIIQPPSSLRGPLRELFVEQEKARFKMRTKHLVEKEKLVLAVEQEILRVHGRAARALANQTVPYSACTILRDEDIYNPSELSSKASNPASASTSTSNGSKDGRSRYNGRLFISWLQDVDDKWEKIKEQMVLRHHNEAESLNAVQKMDWEWKVSEMDENELKSTSAQMDDLHIPMVRVSDDFALSNF